VAFLCTICIYMKRVVNENKNFEKINFHLSVFCCILLHNGFVYGLKLMKVWDVFLKLLFRRIRSNTLK
jgi:hypothetical protein